MEKAREIMEAEEGWREHASGSTPTSSSLDIALLALADPIFKQLALADCNQPNVI